EPPRLFLVPYSYWVSNREQCWHDEGTSGLHAKRYRQPHSRQGRLRRSDLFPECSSSLAFPGARTFACACLAQYEGSHFQLCCLSGQSRRRPAAVPTTPSKSCPDATRQISHP